MCWVVLQHIQHRVLLCCFLSTARSTARFGSYPQRAFVALAHGAVEGTHRATTLVCYGTRPDVPPARQASDDASGRVPLLSASRWTSWLTAGESLPPVGRRRGEDPTGGMAGLERSRLRPGPAGMPGLGGHRGPRRASRVRRTRRPEQLAAGVPSVQLGRWCGGDQRCSSSSVVGTDPCRPARPDDHGG